jgi:hypothetical protein
MAQKYERRQKVMIKAAKLQHFTPRDVDIEGYAGQSGEITDYYWITLGTGRAFYIYTVKVGDKEIVLHEDEMEPYLE